MTSRSAELSRMIIRASDEEFRAMAERIQREKRDAEAEYERLALGFHQGIKN